MLGQNRGLYNKIIQRHNFNFFFFSWSVPETTIPYETQGRRNVIVLAGNLITCESWAAFCATEQLEMADVFFQNVSIKRKQLDLQSLMYPKKKLNPLLLWQMSSFTFMDTRM